MDGAGRLPAYLAGPDLLQGFLAAGLRADPPPATLGEERFALDAQEYLWAAAVDLAAEAWTGAALTAAMGAAPASEGLGRHAVYEVLAATASGLAQGEACPVREDGPPEVLAVEEAPPSRIDAEIAQVALGRVQAFVAASGFGALVRVFRSATLHEDLQAIEFHDPMPEERFLSGQWHRPWVSYPLQDDLLMAAAAGLLRTECEREREVWITPHGRRVLHGLRASMGEAGWLEHRQRRLAAAHHRWLDASGRRHPGWEKAWEDLLLAAGVCAGSRVVVLGLAAGGDAFLHAVAARVGPSGVVLVVDPAATLWRPLQRRGTGARSGGVPGPARTPGPLGPSGPQGASGPGGGARRGLPANVRVLAGDFSALPLSDAAVDVCLVPQFLHLGGRQPAVHEMRRVVRSGGRVVLGVPHAADAGHALLREWLEPLVEVAAHLEAAEARGAERGIPARAQGGGGASLAVRAGVALAREALQRHGFLDLDVRPHACPTPHALRAALLQALHGSEAGRCVLERTPWRQRAELLASLLERGERLLASSASVGGALVCATVP